MKKYFLFCLLFIVGLFLFTTSQQAYAVSIDSKTLIAADALPQDGSWIIDPEVTRIGKNASRSGQLLDWTLKDYQWSTAASQQSSDNPLASFWIIIQRIVYALFLVVILITSFILIVTRGKSLSAKRFLPRFLLAVILVTFSFSLIQFIYQFVDILQGFFLNNSRGQIISSKDLLFIGFQYTDFEGLRRFGSSFDESAFMSLILVKFTAFTYYVMALLLIFRKILLWFFIVLSPLFPILLLFYPMRNTGKVWIGEFFRWVLYAPLFAIFLSGLVRLWDSPSGLPLLFNFTGVKQGDMVYPTAVNILLGGPGQKIGLNNSVNLPDTFALYVVSLIMLWAVIILPFILLQIFLDHMMAYNYQNNPITKQITNLMASRLAPPSKPLGPPPSSNQPAGLARNIPFGRHFEVPSSVGDAKEIPRSFAQQNKSQTVVKKNVVTKSVVNNLANLSIPTMRDIARYEIEKRSHDTSRIAEIERTKKTLIQIASPTTLSISSERERYQAIRERLRLASQKGDTVATNILQAANTYNYYSSQDTSSTTINQGVKNLANPERILSTVEKEKVEKIKERIIQNALEGNPIAKQVAAGLSQFSSSQLAVLKQILQALSSSALNQNSSNQYESLRERLVTASNSGNTVATTFISTIEKSSSEQDVKSLFEALIKAEKEGNPIAKEVMSSVDKNVSQVSTENLKQVIKEAKDKKDPLGVMIFEMMQESSVKEQKVPASAATKLKSGTFPVVNRIQEVSFDDYEAVKKMWRENYKNLKSAGFNGDSRRDEINNDISHMQETISLLSSGNQEMIEQGMRQVSDILPFLLIGGFSQTEIITYLKAKLEAAKSTLEDLTAKDDEEDTLLAAEKAVKHTSKTMTMSAEAPISAKQVIPQEVSTGSVHTTLLSPPLASGATSIFNIVNLPIVTLRDIVRIDQKRETTTDQKSEITILKQNLLNIGHPERVTSVDEREKYKTLHTQLVEEDKKGNPSAKIIINAISELDNQTSDSEIDNANKFISLLGQQMIPGDKNEDRENEISQLILRESASNPLAESLRVASQQWYNLQKEKTKDFLEKISNPSLLPTAAEQMQYTKLMDRISLASSNGNSVASYVVKAIREKDIDHEIPQIYVKIAEGERNGDELSTYLMRTIYNTASHDTKIDAESIFQKTVSQGRDGDLFASKLLKEIAKIAKQLGKKTTPVTSLPHANRIQTVTLDDYEEVKRMWEENYASFLLDSSKSSDEKKRIIEKDVNSLTLAINLLSSTDSEQMRRGMDMVSDLLPFLLLGGFSQPEIIGYLKAKRTAAESVFKSENSLNEELVSRNKRQENPIQQKVQVVDE
ncbi:MAG: hypothetical protein HZC02_03695 [Candidatus Levybacteria bacterium]|nr:hypothetical protein [Candidatus Levybacteria bacterium]